MKSSLIALCALVMGLALAIPDAEAARLGGGRSSGMQRSVTPSQSTAPAAPQRQASPSPQQPSPAAPAPQAAPKRSWLGPIAGLAAGLGLAALASHFGFGEGMANFLMIALLAMAAIFLVKFLFRRSQASRPSEPLQYAGVGGPSMAPIPEAPAVLAGDSVKPMVATSASPTVAPIPADFDSEGFLRVAKLNFVRLQAANDQGNLDDMREFLAPEMFAEVKLQLAERGSAPQQTDVVQLEATLLEVVTEANRHVASVRFHGLLREEKDQAPAAFDEVWHLTKPLDGSRGWAVSGIQQLS